MINSWNFFLLTYGLNIDLLFLKFVLVINHYFSVYFLHEVNLTSKTHLVSGISFVFWENSYGHGVNVVFNVLFIQF